MNQTAFDFDRPAPAVAPICCEPADVARLTGHNLEILNLLKLRPATNRELATISLKYTGRISDLRRAGYEIVNQRLDGGLTRYTLILKEGQR